MTTHRSANAPDAVPGTSYLGSFAAKPGHGVIVLRGEVDADVVDRLSGHIDRFLADGTRFLVIEAAAVDSYDTDLLELLGRTQRRLGRRRGLLQIRGLHPFLPTSPAAPAGSTVGSEPTGAEPSRAGVRVPPSARAGRR